MIGTLAWRRNSRSTGSRFLKTFHKRKTTVARYDGFLGLGILVRRMVSHLIKAGHELVVWNRMPGRCEPLIEMGLPRREFPPR